MLTVVYFVPLVTAVCYMLWVAWVREGSTVL